MRLSLALFALASLNAQLLVDTYAGGVVRSGVPAQNVAVGTISGIAWDPSGNIVFCDTTYNVIRRIDANGMIETIAGTGVIGFAGDGGPAADALISSPSLVHYDPAGNLYFNDSGNFRIRKIDTAGVITTIAGDGQLPILGLDTTGPALTRSIPKTPDLAVDASGNVYIAGNGNILRVTPSGNLAIFAQIQSPQSMAIDGAGNLYAFSSTGFGTIYRISPAGVVSTFVSLPTNVPVPDLVRGLTADTAGNVYAFVYSNLLRYAPDGSSSTVAGLPSGVSSPMSIDSKGDFAFAATDSIAVYGLVTEIKVFSNQSVATTVAGANPQPAPDGTPLRQAWFLGPLAMAFSHTGDLYIGETQACLIRKINAAGVLSTFAGTGTCGYPSPTGTWATANLVYPNSIAIDSQNRVWVADAYLNLYSISQQGALSPMIKTPVSGGSGYIAIDSKDRVNVLGLFSLYRVLADGSYQGVVLPPEAGGGPNTLAGIGTDSAGNVYFGNTNPPTPNVYVVNDDASFTLKYPGFSASAIAFDPSGNIWGGGFATDNASGIANLGLLQPGFSGDGGPLQSAGSNGGRSIGFGPDGNLYFVDGYRIRRVTGSGPTAAPVISQGGIVNGANYGGGPIAPGELISIFGSNFGASGLQINAANNNAVPFTIGRTKVLFNNRAGAISAITPNQINVFVPYELTPGTPVNVQVQVDNILSAPLSMPVAAAAPGLSPPILNQDGTLNSSANPAARGSIVSLYGTGLGNTMPQLLDGYLAISTPYSTPTNTPSVAIGSQPASILYAGDAPTLATGVFQINAAVPTTITPGPQPVSLAIAGSSSQVTVFVK